VGVRGEGPATRRISIGPPTTASRATGARYNIHLFSSSREESLLQARKLLLIPVSKALSHTML
jgi:hypothetical protein